MKTKPNLKQVHSYFICSGINESTSPAFNNPTINLHHSLSGSGGGCLFPCMKKDLFWASPAEIDDVQQVQQMHTKSQKSINTLTLQGKLEVSDISIYVNFTSFKF